MRRLILPLVVALAVLTACGDTEGTNDGGYISGDGQVTQYAADDRGEPVELSGTTLDDEKLDVADLRGRPVVVNVWWSGCGPCREEMPMLQETHQKLGDDVAFVGVNTRDNSKANGRSFERYYGVKYPSIYSPDGEAVRALARHIPPQTIPATLVLDPEGRVAARIQGAIPSQTTLEEIIEDAAADE